MRPGQIQIKGIRCRHKYAGARYKFSLPFYQQTGIHYHRRYSDGYYHGDGYYHTEHRSRHAVAKTSIGSSICGSFFMHMSGSCENTLIHFSLAVEDISMSINVWLADKILDSICCKGQYPAFNNNIQGSFTSFKKKN